MIALIRNLLRCTNAVPRITIRAYVFEWECRVDNGRHIWYRPRNCPVPGCDPVWFTVLLWYHLIPTPPALEFTLCCASAALQTPSPNYFHVHILLLSRAWQMSVMGFSACDAQVALFVQVCMAAK